MTRRPPTFDINSKHTYNISYKKRCTLLSLYWIHSAGFYRGWGKGGEVIQGIL